MKEYKYLEQPIPKHIVKQIRADAIAEVKEVLATMVVHEVIDNFAYEQIIIQIGVGE